MSWAAHHGESARLADAARAALWRGDDAEARDHYRAAGRAELEALGALRADQQRTYGITAVSAAALFYKGGDFSEAERVAREALASPTTPDAAKRQLEDMLAAIAAGEGEGGQRPGGTIAGSEDLVDLLELFFFAYRDFVGDADRLLETYGFGRAHHRVLHFVCRRPGISVTALLDILKITKQSLARVLKDLVEAGFVEARAGPQDRRQRLLELTPAGAELAQQMMRLQSARFERVMSALTPSARAAAAEFLFLMIDESDHERILTHLELATRPSGAPSRSRPLRHASGATAGKAAG